MKVELRQLTKSLGGNTILDSIDAVLEGAQIVSVLGANGAGKTTLLHLLAGLYQPTAGEVVFDGRSLRRSDIEQRRRFHYLPDIPILNPSLTPIDYIVYAVEAYGLSSEETDRKIVELLNEFELLPVADSPVRSLSRGQRYKTTLVALLAVDPEMWILDEPFTSGMDPLGLSAMRSHFVEARKRGRLIVYSTQLVEIAQQNADQVCVLAEARIAALGSPGSLQQSAANSAQLNELLMELRGEGDDADV